MDYSGLFDFARDIYADYSFDNKTGNIKLPMRYILELTYRCNLKCPFCYITEDRNIEELSVEEWLDIIDQIPPFSIITFVAGEILLKEGFDRIYKKASEKFRKVTLITNGLKLDEQTIDLFIKNKLFLLSVSLDAIGEKHDKIRNHPGLYDKVINNINILNQKRHGKYNPMLDIKTCVLENNLDDFGAQLESYGTGLKSFADSVQGFDKTAITNIYMSIKVTKLAEVKFSCHYDQNC